MTIYLYKKTHNITGLNYLGKTKQDPFVYTGSGKYWTNHIRKHGNNVTTTVLKECQTHDELKHWGTFYSELWNIVESKEWANIRPETGDGGDTSNTPNYQKNRHLFSHKGPDNPAYGKRWYWTDEQKKSVSGINHHGYNKNWTPEQREKREKNGYYWTGKKRIYTSRKCDINGAKNPNAKKVITPNGIFETVKEASESHKIGPNALRGRIKKYPTEYYYL